MVRIGSCRIQRETVIQTGLPDKEDRYERSESPGSAALCDGFALRCEFSLAKTRLASHALRDLRRGVGFERKRKTKRGVIREADHDPRNKTKTAAVKL